MNHAGANLILRSAVWLGALTWWVYLRKPAGSSVFQLRLSIGTLAAGVLAAVGLLSYLWAARTLASAVSSAIDAPAQLFMHGPFRYVRNPLYLGPALLFAGVSALYPPWRLRDLFAAIVVGALIHIFVVRREEPATRRRLGSAYDDYCALVPRWIPRIFRTGAMG